MNETVLINTLTRILSIGALAITVFVMIGNVTDPVNAPKLFLLGGVAGSAIALVVLGIVRSRTKPTIFEYLILLFVSWGGIAVFQSNSPFSQNIYGTYGRNTGWLTYFFLGCVAIAGARIRETKNFQKILGGFLIAVGINIVYGLWVIMFGDFLSWNNTYGAILGTFGNPNFISTFLGMSFSAILALTIRQSGKKRVSGLLILPIIAWELIKADSLQGIVVAILGTWVIGLFWLWSIVKGQIIPLTYFGIGSFVGAAGILGALGHGPLKQALAQPTVALREQYWLAALHMVSGHPFFGVGMDSYGDWYRRARGAQALITPGPDTVTNVSHNVFLDLMASGGIPFFLNYALIVCFGLISILRISRRKREYDATFVTLSVLWVGYQAQSLISINQIGLAVWGWLLTGLLVGYEIDSRVKNRLTEAKVHSRKNLNVKNEIISPQLIASIGMVIGLIIAVPPLNADLRWRSVQATGQASKLESTFSGEYLSPLNSYTLAVAVELLEKSQLPDLAIKYARQGVRFNPNSLDAWRMLYYASKSTSDEKIQAKREMIRLDPLNPEWKNLS